MTPDGLAQPTGFHPTWAFPPKKLATCLCYSTWVPPRKIEVPKPYPHQLPHSDFICSTAHISSLPRRRHQQLPHAVPPAEASPCRVAALSSLPHTAPPAPGVFPKPAVTPTGPQTAVPPGATPAPAQPPPRGASTAFASPAHLWFAPKSQPARGAPLSPPSDLLSLSLPADLCSQFHKNISPNLPLRSVLSCLCLQEC
jgi:hypothetical protein